LGTRSEPSHQGGPVSSARRWAELTPDAVAYEFVGLDGSASSLTYRELAERSLRVASLIRGRAAGPSPGPVLLLYPPGLDYVVALLACMIARVPAVPAYPPEWRGSHLDMTRLNRLIADATPTAVLADRSLTDLLGLDAWPTTPTPTIIPLNAGPEEVNEEFHCWPEPPVEDDIAIIQYTSGSTRVPRGVIVRHGNLTHNILAIIHGFELSRESRAVSWLPPYHDMGLVGGILTPLYAGFPIRLMSPLDFLKKPVFWLEQISETQATASGGPNFAYDLCVRRASNDADANALDLSSWSVAFNGAEPVRSRTLTAFAERFAPAGFQSRAFFPCYGLAEATLIVSGGHWDGTLFAGTERLPGHEAAVRRRDEPLRVGSGRALGDSDLAIVEPGRLTRLPDGKEGEVWVRGPGVSTGYWGGDDQDSFGELDGRRYLRTGDLGFLVDGELVISGRRKDVIVYRGANYHAADIEEHAVMAPAARPVAAAFAVDGEDGTTVVVVIEARAECAEPASLAGSVRSLVAAATGLAPHVIVVTPPGGIPRTSSGKVQRWLCRDMFVSGRLDALATMRAAHNAGSSVENPESLTELICGVFAAVCGAQSCLPHTTLFELGGDSLSAAEIASVLEGALAVPVAVDLVLVAQTSAALASRLTENECHP
jgi:acyl-CoA synthetase (AMP-forming)/AMP-acid ligase II